MLGPKDNNENIKWFKKLIMKTPILPYATQIEIYPRISGLLKKFMMVENVI